MNIIKTQTGSRLTLALEGRLDTTTSPKLEQELKTCLNGVTELIMDLAKLEYISSAGLRVMLVAHRTMLRQGSMKLIHCGEMVKDVFDVTGFSDMLDIE